MKQTVFILVFILSALYSNAQYTVYVGAGHNDNVTVSASSQQTRTDWNELALAENTTNGLGLDARLLETSRFLAQATLGTDLDYIQLVSEGTFEEWIDAQFLLPETPESLGELIDEVYDEARGLYFDNGGEGSYSGPTDNHFQYAWWQINTGNEDLLRQRAALALSEIFSFSHLFTADSWGDGSGYYYDVLQDNAFGNFKDLLLDVTLQPMMGFYLTYYNNPKSNASSNQFPDENYAREVMQLFTIGLSELNQDGTYVLDGEGKRIPTYDNDDIAEFAKVFTGLGAGATTVGGVSPSFGIAFNSADKQVPMAMYNPYHEEGTKQLLNGYTIPTGQDGMQDVDDAITHLFNHPNTPPFVSYRLIQRLVKSNPSPAYVSSVSAAFINNGSGVRGDMKAILKAILLHSEARSCSWATNPNQGKLREPMIRYYNLVHQLDKNNPSGYAWNTGDRFREYTYQAPLSAYSIFNFFYPDFPPNGPISDAGLVGPEFQIHDSYTSIGFANQFDSYIRNENSLFDNLDHLGIADTTIDFTHLKYLAKDNEVLINYLDKLFTHGQLTNESRQVIKTAMDEFSGTDDATLLSKSKMALWLFLISPDYAIIK